MLSLVVEFGIVYVLKERKKEKKYIIILCVYVISELFI